MRLTIAIPTVKNREVKFNKLYNYLKSQATDEVEVISLCDNKEISIGAKRQKLLEMSKGDFTVQIDDDDWVPPDFVKTILNYIDIDPKLDAMGYWESCDFGSKKSISYHSNRFAKWNDRAPYERTLFFKDVIKTSIALQIGVKDLRFGEDVDFANRLKESGLLKVTVDIPKIMYFYRYASEPHNVKYGIK